MWYDRPASIIISCFDRRARTLSFFFVVKHVFGSRQHRLLEICWRFNFTNLSGQSAAMRWKVQWLLFFSDWNRQKKSDKSVVKYHRWRWDQKFKIKRHWGWWIELLSNRRCASLFDLQNIIESGWDSSGKLSLSRHLSKVDLLALRFRSFVCSWTKTKRHTVEVLRNWRPKISFDFHL